MRIAICLLFLLLCGLAGTSLYGQQETLEQRQPLELVFADSIVPQDRHEMMSTTGVWYFRNGISRNASLTQKIEWGISDQLQISTFVHLVNRSNQVGAMQTGFGDFEIGARYSWPKVGSEFTHLAIALDAGFPTGNSQQGLGEGNYIVSPSILFSRELGQGKYQLSILRERNSSPRIDGLLRFRMCRVALFSQTAGYRFTLDAAGWLEKSPSVAIA